MPVTDSSHTLKEAAEADAKVILKKYEDICKSKNVSMHLKLPSISTVQNFYSTSNLK